MKTPPDQVTKAIMFAAHHFRTLAKSLHHQEYCLSDMVNITTSYDPRQFKLALVLTANSIDDLLSTLSIVKKQLQEAAERCEP